MLTGYTAANRHPPLQLGFSRKSREAGTAHAPNPGRQDFPEAKSPFELVPAQEHGPERQIGGGVQT